MTLAAFKVAPALAAGCTVVLKPSELAPLSLFVLAEQIHRAGFPPGVFNLVTGYGSPVGERLVGHPEVDMVTFTGSTATGRQVGATAAASVKRVHLELGGKSAAIILADADLARSVAACLQQAFMNNGQTCLAWTRLLVPEDRHDEVVEIVRQAVEHDYPVGDPRRGAAVGPVVSRAQQERIRSFIRSGVEEGAVLVIGGPEAPDGLPKGYYVRPTVFARVDNGMTIAREEIFGPVLCVIPYRDEQEAVTIANDSIFGLHGAVFGADTARAAAVARQLRTGQVDINGFTVGLMAPFGGYKQSGNGKELGVEGFEAFLETKAVKGVPQPV